MTLQKRLRALTALLGVAAATAAIGTTLFGDVRDGPSPTKAGFSPIRPEGGNFVDELAVTRFSNLPALTYQVRSTGELLFAWQIKPSLPAAPARPRDLLVVVDSSASQAGKPLHQARQIIHALASHLTADDRMSIWTLSTPAATRALTEDLQPANSDNVKIAADALIETEYGSGATDLKGGLKKALDTLPPNRGRHQILLFLGDGESAFDPVSENDRIALGTRMDQNDVYFFAVPLGVKLDPQNLHGFAALTGGTVVRVQEDLNKAENRDLFVKRLNEAFDTPVFKAEKYNFGAEVAEVFPTRLPPLRGDKPTLVMGKLAKKADKVTATMTGTAGGRPVTFNLAQDLPPSQPDHFFLNMMVAQWREAPHSDAPAVLQADRALALASTQVKLYREEFLTQAVWAVTMDRLDEAAKLYTAAQKIDPNDPEAGAGLQMVEKMKTGRLTKAELQKQILAKADALKVDKNGAARTVIQENAGAEAQPPTGAQPAQPPAPGVQPKTPPGATPPTPADLIREAEALRRIEEQRYRVLVDQTIRRARQLLRTDPDQAYQDLKRQRDDILAYGGIGEAARSQLVADLNAVMQEIFLKGAEIRRQAAAEREQIARVTQRLNEFDRLQAENDRTKARIDAFRQLMQQARYELAYQEAQLMIQERISRGQAVPPAATASYIIGQHATQLREWRELVRIRDDRFLLAMMQTEKSHIPYPDEPPVHFPPAAVWRELTGLRKERYENSILGPEASPTQKKMQSILENERVSLQGKDLTITPLPEILSDLAKRYDITFVINKTAFDQPAALDDARATNLGAPRLDGLTLGTFLDIYLRGLSVPDVTYVVRPDYIEITSYDKRLSEKVTRVFPVADLVIPIPAAVNQQTLFQNLSVQQQTLAIFGQASLYGGGLSNFIGGNQFGGQNPFGQGGGLGGPGIGGQGGGQQGNPFFGGQNQGGIVGLGGNGGLGQFGNLGGQFGLQGGTQQQVLMGLIFETVAKGEWANVPPPMNDPNAEAEESFLPIDQQNSLGYYPPAYALIVRGTSRYHSGGTMKLKKRDGFAAAPRPNNDPLVIGPRSTVKPGPAANPNPPRDPVAAKVPPRPADTQPVVIDGKKPTLVDPKLDPEVLLKKIDRDPKRMWNQAVEMAVTNPTLLFGAAVVLFEANEYGHAAEVIKANLRKGLATDEWAHEALAISLQMSNANPVEVERAALSAIDLDPADPKAYLKAAKIEAELKNHDQAVAFCKRAAEYGPDQPGPYANALAYAEEAKNVTPDTVAWAASNLLRRDWASDGVDYHGKTRDLLPKFVHRFAAAGVKSEKLNEALTEETQRDLVIELGWQGPADLDLTVAEPGGSVCSATNKRTTGGGVLKADLIAQTSNSRSESYTAAAAFSGTYKVGVKRAFGTVAGNTAQIRVTRFKGTPRESFDLLTIDLNDPKPVEIKLDGGSRKELARVEPDVTELKVDRFSTGVAEGKTVSGIGGGVGSAGSMMSEPVAGTAGDPRLPAVAAPKEKVLPGLGSAADIRASYKLNPDRKGYSIHVTPVFSTAGELKLPKVPLLPGGE